MPLELQVIRANEFIRAGAQGRPDFRASREILAKLAGACRQHGIQRALLDLREIRLGPTPAFTPVQLESLVDTFHQAGFSGAERLAVLYVTDPHHGARMFAFIGKLRGWNVKAFSSYEEALGWLALTEETISTPEAE